MPMQEQGLLLRPVHEFVTQLTVGLPVPLVTAMQIVLLEQATPPHGSNEHGSALFCHAPPVHVACVCVPPLEHES